MSILSSALQTLWLEDEVECDQIADIQAFSCFMCQISHFSYYNITAIQILLKSNFKRCGCLVLRRIIMQSQKSKLNSQEKTENTKRKQWGRSMQLDVGKTYLWVETFPVILFSTLADQDAPAN